MCLKAISHICYSQRGICITQLTDVPFASYARCAFPAAFCVSHHRVALNYGQRTKSDLKRSAHGLPWPCGSTRDRNVFESSKLNDEYASSCSGAERPNARKEFSSVSRIQNKLKMETALHGARRPSWSPDYTRPAILSRSNPTDAHGTGGNDERRPIWRLGGTTDTTVHANPSHVR